jgi:hypothetical protein
MSKRQDFLIAHDIDDPYDGENLCLQRTRFFCPSSKQRHFVDFPIGFSMDFPGPKGENPHKKTAVSVTASSST